MRFLCAFGMNERGVYIVVVEEIEMKDYLMRVDKNHEPRPHFSIWGNLVH